jgi:hypothetical protein
MGFFRRRARRRAVVAGTMAVAGAHAAHGAEAQEAPPEEQAPPPPAAEQGDLDELQKLADLHASGALTDEEFEAEKAKILGAG